MRALCAAWCPGPPPHPPSCPQCLLTAQQVRAQVSPALPTSPVPSVGTLCSLLERPELPPTPGGVLQGRRGAHGNYARGSCSLHHPMVTPPPAPVCGPYEFPCQSGQCVPRGWVCDSEADCPDNSDELGCNRSCVLGHFPCALGAHCIHYDHLCDGIPHCPDHSDESDDNCGEALRVPLCPYPQPWDALWEQGPRRGS